MTGEKTSLIKQLTENGYHQFEVPASYYPCVDAFFSKKVRDAAGKLLYIIDAKIWKPLGYEPEQPCVLSVRLFEKDTHNLLTMEFAGSWGLQKAEETAAAIYQSGIFEPLSAVNKENGENQWN